MKLLLWHVHGSWTTAFLQGPHEYLLPRLPDRGPDGRGRALTWTWPASAREVTPAELLDEQPDLVILQRPHELELCARWMPGVRLGIDLPAIYVEHNAPQGAIAQMHHPLRDRPELLIVHVTHFNDLFWDTGLTPTRVIEHGILDPGYRYSGELRRCAVAINEPRRRGRVTGTDLLRRLGQAAAIDLFGIGAGELGGLEDPPQELLHAEMPRRRLYLHPFRWTSLGLSLIEAMHLGMPVVALATTEVPEAVPPGAGFLSTDVEALSAHVVRLMADHEEAFEVGMRARRAALARYSLERFLNDWQALLADVAGPLRPADGAAVAAVASGVAADGDGLFASLPPVASACADQAPDSLPAGVAHASGSAPPLPLPLSLGTEA